MKITVIGAGNVGSAIAKAGARTGHEVTVTATDTGKAQQLAGELGCTAVESTTEAVRDADAAVLAVPYSAVGPVAEEIREPSTGKVVIDATNPLKADYSGLATTERSGAEELQRLLSAARVVKAFNTVFATKQADPVTDGVALDGLYAGDDEDAKRVVAEFLAEIGYRPLDAGDLTAARALEHMAFLNISLNARNNWPWQSGWKLVGPTG